VPDSAEVPAFARSLLLRPAAAAPLFPQQPARLRPRAVNAAGAQQSYAVGNRAL